VNTKLIVILLVSLLSFSVEAKPRKNKRVQLVTSPQPTDMDWTYYNGDYVAFWPGELEDGFAWIIGPQFPEGIRVMKDGQDAVTFKWNLKFLVDSVSGY